MQKQIGVVKPLVGERGYRGGRSRLEALAAVPVGDSRLLAWHSLYRPDPAIHL